jgi:hypothetical protein
MFKQKGYIYILSNPSFKNLYKVGMTTRNPDIRAEEMSQLTAVPTPFKVEYFLYIEDCSEIEAFIHKLLEQRGFRISENREFFLVDLSELMELFQALNKAPIIPKANKFRNKLIVRSN